MNSAYEEFIEKRTYSRWMESDKRREDWVNSVGRYSSFLVKRVPKQHQDEFLHAVNAVIEQRVMGSMRALWTAGNALERENICGYNCAFTIIDSVKTFAEILYILMNGTGVGYSVERQFIVKLPDVPATLNKSDKPIVFADSKRGWAEGFYTFMRELYNGTIRPADLSKVRPKGARLKTFGGRASGPEPLQDLLKYTERIFQNAAGRKLNSIECHDICCFIASVVVVGGVRRSACICLSNLSDDRMAKAKTGEFWNINPQRSYANNSVAYTEKPDSQKLIAEFLNLIQSNTGERGIFNRQAAEFTVAATGRREVGYEWGCNPCGEISLRPNEFCNLTEVIIRPTDTLKSLLRKVTYATILGCVQSTLTDFKFLSKKWKDNCTDERLLGVSLTGLRDHPVLQRSGKEMEHMLTQLKQRAVQTAEKWSKILNINMPAAITCVKPSGTVSQLVDCSSGLHPRFAPYYIRRVRVSAIDPIARLLVDSGVPNQPEIGSNVANPDTLVFEFPIQAPKGSIMTADVSALEQLEYWKSLKQYWCEHNPSCTIYVKDKEWTVVLDWVNQNWNILCGITFLPYNNGIYRMAPYEEIDQETYNNLSAAMPDIDFTKLSQYEQSDLTIGGREYACAGGQCEL